jgi:MFS transporter, DHA3 family, macrolide efflux protein
MTSVRTDLSDDRSDSVPASGIRTYILLWLSQWLACAAVSFTVFVIGVNIFMDFGSLWMIALGYAILFVPFPILSPFAGAFVDRFGHRPALLISNIGTLANLSILVLVMLTGTGGALYAICAVGISTILRTLQLAAIESVVPLLVPKRHYGRANGPRMLLTGTFVLAGPLLAFLLLSVFEPVTIVMAECVLVVIAIYVVFKVRLPVVQRPGGDAVRQSLGRDVVDAYRSLRVRNGLLTMVGFLAVVSGVLGALEVAASGTVLGFAPASGAIVVSTSCWLGMVVASIAMVVWGVPRRLVLGGLLGAGLVFGVALVAASFRPNLILMCVGGFVAMGSLAIIIASFQTVLHLKVEPHLLGRAIGLKNTAVTLSHIVGDVGALVVGMSIFANSGRSSGDGVWGWRQGQGWEDVSSPVLAAFIGDGPGRGWALFMMLIGVGVAAVVALLRFRSRGLLRLEDDLPDVTPEEDRLRQSTGDFMPVGVTESAPGGRSA